MKKIIVIMCMAVLSVCCPIPSDAGNVELPKTSRTAKKKGVARKKASGLLATFKVEGNAFQLLPGGKIKCTTDANWRGSYEKKSGYEGYSVHSPKAEWYIVHLWYIRGDGEYIYLIWNGDDRIRDLGGGSVGVSIDVDPIYHNVTIVTDDEPNDKKTIEIDNLPVAGTVKWIKR
ncbi:MAG: hypothetical protein J6L73_02600 [Muribaculaceae bacterium]|nr:hypothetical protein [Muribaculaceae bacterium]